MGPADTRCTFAIISHPDAGKTTITEKILWWGEVIRNTGMVKSKQGNFAKSDWMSLEQERGISVSSSVMSFPYLNRSMHLLDTPGHNDFSEDTYRTLTAVESALMMIDSAKGVEAQTIKLMDVCRMRDTPIVTFINKLDRDGLGPLEVLDNIEKVLNIQCIPLTWPIGEGNHFKGVYSLIDKTISLFHEDRTQIEPKKIDATDFENDAVKACLSSEEIEQLQNDLEFVQELMPNFQEEEFLAGIVTPVFFGTALHNFGVDDVLNFMAEHCPGPKKRSALRPPYQSDSESIEIDPAQKEFTGFIFKIQANMDKRHRDRVAFLRVCSGKFTRHQKIFNCRTEKEIKISTPLIFQAQDRNLVEEAYAGDIIGLHDTGKLQIGDTFTEGTKLLFTGIPQFAPEIFMKVDLKDPMKAKQLDKGLRQLSEEGCVQLFTRLNGPEKILGAVGMLQFDVVKFRLEDEYNVRGEYSPYSFSSVRWPQFVNKDAQKDFIQQNGINILHDHKDRICFAVRSEWDLKLVQEKFPEVKFYKNSDYR